MITVGIRRDHLIPTVFTLSLHLIVVVAVLAGWQMNDSKRFRVETPPYVRATLVTLESVTAQPAASVSVPQAAPAASVKAPKAIERKATPQPKESAAPKEVAISKPEKKTPAKPPAETQSSKPEPKETAKPEPEPEPEPKPAKAPEPVPAEPVCLASYLRPVLIPGACYETYSSSGFQPRGVRCYPVFAQRRH